MIKYWLIRLLWNIDQKIVKKKSERFSSSIYYSTWWKDTDERGEPYMKKLMIDIVSIELQKRIELAIIHGENWLDHEVNSADMERYHRQYDEATGKILNNIFKGM